MIIKSGTLEIEVTTVHDTGDGGLYRDGSIWWACENRKGGINGAMHAYDVENVTPLRQAGAQDWCAKHGVSMAY